MIFSYVVWITGLSGSGKTTIAKLLKSELFRLKNINSILIDGDEIRKAFFFENNYSFEERKKIAYSYANLAKLLCDQGFFVIVSTISMFEEVRKFNREQNKNYFETYLKISEEVRTIRDSKGYYANQVELVRFDNSFEEPKNPDLVINDSEEFSQDCIVSKIMYNLKI